MIAIFVEQPLGQTNTQLLHLLIQNAMNNVYAREITVITAYLFMVMSL